MIAKTPQLRNAIALTALLSMATGPAAATTLTVGGQVDDAGDGTPAQGTTWQLYDAADSTLKVTGLVGALQANTWLGEAGHFLGPLAVGDELLMMAETEADPGLQTHAGYYAVTNHVLDGQDPAAFSPATLRAIPAPDVQLEPGYTAQLSWTTPTEDTSSAGIIGYHVHRSEDGVTFTQLTTVPVSTTGYVDSGFPVSTTYYAISLAYSGAPEVAGAVISANSNYMHDTEGDGLDDQFEVSLGTSITLIDTDGDGLTDYEEVAYNGDPNDYDPATEPDPTNPDSDGDGANDGADAFPRDPDETLDTDLDGIGNNADEDDDGDGYLDVDETAVFSDPLDKLDIPPLHVPTKPVVIEPDNGLIVDAGYRFGFNAFADIDIPKGDSLQVVQWKITDPLGLNVVMDRLLQSRPGSLFELPVDITMLQTNIQYSIWLKHGDSTGLWSEWSNEVLFTVSDDLGEITDDDSNGIEDTQQVNGYADTNSNTVDDASEGILVINDAEQGLPTGLYADNGTIDDLKAVTASSVYPNIAEIGVLPYGLFSYKVTGLTSTESVPAVVNLTIHYTGALPSPAQWLRYDPVTGATDDASVTVQFNSGSVTYTLTDGGAGDLDGTVNGTIVDYSGIAALLDSDLDGLFNLFDNCTQVANPSQCDGDSDGYGNHCDADFNGDLIINGLDVGPFKTGFGTIDPVTDLNCDGITNGLDVGPFKAMFGKAPGPSGLRQ